MTLQLVSDKKPEQHTHVFVAGQTPRGIKIWVCRRCNATKRR